MLTRSAARLATLALALAPVALGGCLVREAYPDRALTPGGHPMADRAEQAYLRGNLEESLDLYRAFRVGYAEESQRADCYYWEGVILLELGDAAQAKEHLLTAARTARTPELEANAWAGVGDCAFAAERFDEALAHYQRAVDLRVPEARNDYALYRLGVTRQRLGDWPGGQSYLEEIIRHHAESPLAERVRERLAFPGRAFYVELGRFEERAAAETALLAHRARGLPVRLVSGYDGAPHRVWMGGYRTFDQARDGLEAAARLGLTDLTIVP